MRSSETRDPLGPWYIEYFGAKVAASLAHL
jgi:hypothetical protein